MTMTQMMQRRSPRSTKSSLKTGKTMKSSAIVSDFKANGYNELIYGSVRSSKNS